MKTSGSPTRRRRPRRLAVGEFDGVHAGHREVIRGADSVLTFEPHPRTVVAPQSAPKLLTTLEQKTDLIAALGVEELIVIPFDGARAAQTAQEFIDHELVAAARRDAGLGRRELPLRQPRAGRRGSCCAAQDAFTTRVVELVEIDGEIVSSTHIRGLIATGAVAEAARLLGAPFGMRGIVAHGDKRGRTLGFPTANLVPDPALAVPDHGIYACRAAVPGRGGVDGGGLDRRPPDVRHRPRAARRGLPPGLRRRPVRPGAAAGLHRAHPRRAPLRLRRHAGRADAPRRGGHPRLDLGAADYSTSHPSFGGTFCGY